MNPLPTLTRPSARRSTRIDAPQPEATSAYSRNGRPSGERCIDGMSRDEICRQYHNRIVLVARKVAEKLPPDCELGFDDLVSYGAIGLLEAIERFDSSRNILFSTFAEYRVRGAMMDALRQNDSFTRYRRQMARQFGHAMAALTSELGRPPEPEEIANRLGMDMETYWHASQHTQPVSHVSLDGTPSDGDDERPLSDMLIGSDGEDAFRRILNRQARDQLQDAIKALPDRQRQCIVLYYGRGMSLKEIAEVFEVTPSRISQVLTAARDALKDALQDSLSSDDFAWGSQAESL